MYDIQSWRKLAINGSLNWKDSNRKVFNSILLFFMRFILGIMCFSTPKLSRIVFERTYRIVCTVSDKITTWRWKSVTIISTIYYIVWFEFSCFTYVQLRCQQKSITTAVLHHQQRKKTKWYTNHRDKTSKNEQKKYESIHHDYVIR